MRQKTEKLVPSVLTDNSDELSVVLGEINSIYKRGMLTIVDGVFADNLSIAIDDLESLAVGPDLEIHLATEYPTEFLGSVMSVGVKKVWAQVERMGNMAEYVEICEELYLSPRLALDLYTPTVSIKKMIERVDGVLVFGNRAGLPPGKFDLRVLSKIKELRDLGFAGEIGVGVADEEMVVDNCLGEGADIVVVAEKIWRV